MHRNLDIVSDGHFDMYFFLQILKLEENSRTKLFYSAILFQLYNLEKKFRVEGKNLGYVG